MKVQEKNKKINKINHMVLLLIPGSDHFIRVTPNNVTSIVRLLRIPSEMAKKTDM